MDFASATPLNPKVLKEMQKGFSAYGNPSAPHEEAREARELVEDARVRIARSLGTKSDSLIFTGSGTESNNLAVHGVVKALIKRGVKSKDLHVITSSFEHPSLGESVTSLVEEGVQISFVEPNEEGIITPEAVKKLIRPETVLVSLVAVQSEIGQIQPLKDIRRMLDEYREKREQAAQPFAPEAAFPVFHADASQSPLFIDLSPDRIGVDLASYDAQKIMGPKGVGLLYKQSSVPLEPLIKGGKQERGLRPGTENVVGILGMAKAFELADDGRTARIKSTAKVRDYLISLLQKELPQVELNGGIKHRIANNVNISIPGADGDYLAVLMDKEGVAVSARSSCIASGTASQAVASLGKGDGEARGTLRFTLAPWASKWDVRRAVDALKKSLEIIDL